MKQINNIRKRWKVNGVNIMNLLDMTDFCCEITFPMIGLVVSVFLLYLRKKVFL